MQSTDANSRRVLEQIISTVASSLELDDVLRGVVRLLSEGAAVHACFVYLVEGDQLVLRAADEPYAAFVGEVALDRPRGLAWWAVEHNEPAFIPENLLDDPRVEYVPELDEERFQSLLSVPIAARDGTVIGVISAHTEAPHAFSEAEVDFVVTSASLVAGAIENARLYDETRARVRELEVIAELAEAIAGASNVDALLPQVVRHARELLAASACHIYLLEPGSEEMSLKASAPVGASARATVRLAGLGPEFSRRGGSARVAVPLVAGDELVGLLVAEETPSVELARSAASQVAVGLKRIELIERLLEHNRVKDLFDDLAVGRGGPGIEGRAARLGADLSADHVVLVARTSDEEVERRLASAFPGSLFDGREQTLRALLVLNGRDPRTVVDVVGCALAGSTASPSIGLSSVCTGATTLAQGFTEANQAVLGARALGREGTAVAFEDLGAYKYLLRLASDGGVRDTTIDAVQRIAEYDAERGSTLLATLETFLERRGSINATSEALYIHTNTLRQRLRRIGEISGIDLRRDDWLMVEIAVKLVRLGLLEA